MVRSRRYPILGEWPQMIERGGSDERDEGEGGGNGVN